MWFHVQWEHKVQLMTHAIPTLPTLTPTFTTFSQPSFHSPSLYSHPTLPTPTLTLPSHPLPPPQTQLPEQPSMAGVPLGAEFVS